ncbi:hypothetical protein WP50_01655 [Lactiplantibacillus plantarum]|nr:hypothetical protein WP50_01655 [Lactiplantibacillus plantarum]
MKLKFNLSWATYWQEWTYLLVFASLLYIYASMLSAWEITPFITSVFFILGVLTLFWVSQNWIINFFNTHHWRVDQSLITDWYGLIYMMLFVFGMQTAVVGQNDAWIFMNFQLIGLTFCGYY